MQAKARELAKRAAIPAGIFAFTALVYAMVAGPRTEGPAPDNHYVFLAESWLNGQLTLVDERPPGYNDWACYDVESHATCTPDAFTRPRDSQRWYVSFPPFPAVVILPAVAIFGRDFSDPLFWAILAGLAPALMFIVLRRLREDGTSPRSLRDDLLLVTLFAFGSVYFFCAVHGSVWFAAHVVASSLLCLYLLFAIGARRPFWAGLMLGLAFMTRPSVYPFAIFFLLEAMRAARPAEAESAGEDASMWRALWVWLKPIQWKKVITPCAIFAAPILGVGLVAMWFNAARWENPFDFGHQFLMIRWRPRIEKWGLFSYHYFSKNLGVFLASMPWFSAVYPYLKISRHGLAIWITSPNLVAALWPKKVDALMVSLFIATGLVALVDLYYQNSGWVQYGYRFSLDYMPALVVLLALSRRRFGWGFVLLLLVAIAVNTFGAITFDRAQVFYDDDATQDRVFQPD